VRCATANEEKNCAIARAIQIRNRTRAAKFTARNEYRQTRRREKHLFRKKKGQLDDQAFIGNEQHHLKDIKAAGSDSILAELLKSGEPSLVDALN
jgi:hypothetical protein